MHFNCNATNNPLVEESDQETNKYPRYLLDCMRRHDGARGTEFSWLFGCDL